MDWSINQDRQPGLHKCCDALQREAQGFPNTTTAISGNSPSLCCHRQAFDRSGLAVTKGGSQGTAVRPFIFVTEQVTETRLKADSKQGATRCHLIQVAIRFQETENGTFHPNTFFCCGGGGGGLKSVCILSVRSPNSVPKESDRHCQFRMVSLGQILHCVRALQQ